MFILSEKGCRMHLKCFFLNVIYSLVNFVFTFLNRTTVLDANLVDFFNVHV